MNEQRVLNIAVVGCGYWGNHLLRNFNSSENWNLKYAIDSNPKQLEKVAKLYPNTLVCSFEEAIADSEVDAICIATPVSSHFQLAKQALLAGKHIWLEKPLTASVETAKELEKLASDNGLCLNVDHTFIYTPAVKKIKSIIDSGELGNILYFDSVRINLGLFQHDVNVIWDLAPHDISIIQHCIGKKAVGVNAVGKCVMQYGEKAIENIAYLSIHFEDGSIANLHVNWMSPVKIRRIIFGGSKKMLVFDDMEQSEKIKVYDSGINLIKSEDIYDTLVQYRIGDMSSPALSNKEALKEEVELFHSAIINQSQTLTPASAGVYVVEILEAAQKSLEQNGAFVSIN